MKKHNLCRSFIACLLAVTMLLGTCGTVFATEVASNEIVYVSFGDSMTNGYGLAGYNGNNGVLDYGTVSYSNQFADWLVEEGYADSVDHKQLAMSGLRAEDLHWFLELDHESEEIRNYLNDISSGWTWDEEDWYSVFNIGDYRTHGDMCSDRNRSSAAASNILASGYDSPYATQAQKDAADCLNYGTAPEGEGYVHYTNNNQAAIVAEYYQNAVKNADIISMAVGNSNFGTFMFDQIVNAVGYHGAPEDAMNFSIERALTECPAELKETVLDLKDKLYLAIEDYLGIELDYEEGADYIDGEINHNNMTAAIANAAVYAGISYVLNYAGSVDAILKLNPDVEIIQVALMNTYLNTSATSEESTIGSLLDVMFPPINAFIAALPTVMKGAKNEVYEDATFYYAEAPEVACMVEVYGTDFYNEDGTCNRGSITRQRFFSDLLPLIGGMVGNADTFGAPLNYSLPFEELCLYDEMDDNAKAAYAYANTSNAVTCAVYLAFEKATVAGGQQAAVTLDSIMDLGDISFAQFADAAADFYDNMAENVPLKMPVAMGAIAAVFNAAALTDFHLISELDANDVGAVYLADAADKLNTAKAVVQSIADDPRNAAVIEAMAKDGVYAQIDYETIYAGYASANSIPYTWEQFKLYGGAQYAAFVEGVKAQAWTNYGTAAITQAKNTIVNESADILVSSVDYVEKLSKLLALPDSLGDAMADDEKAVSWFGLCARCVIGDGLGGHPAPAGHDSLFDAVKTSYENGYTAQKETLANLKEAAEIAKGYIEEYYDEAYAYAYAEADKAGYVDTAASAIDSAIKVIENLDLSGVEMTDDFRAKLGAECMALISTLNEIKVVLIEDKASDVEGLYNSAVALWDDLNTHLTLITAILYQAEFDVKTLLCPVVDAYIRTFVEEYVKPFVNEVEGELSKIEFKKVDHKHYEADEDSYYVALGSDTLEGAGIARNSRYYQLIGNHYNVSRYPIYERRLLPKDVLALIEENVAEIAKADLITYQLDANSFIWATMNEEADWDKYIDEYVDADVQELVKKIVDEATRVLTMDWTDHADEELAEIIAEVKEAVMSKLPEEIPFAEEIFDAAVEFVVPYLENEIAKIEAKRDEAFGKVNDKVASIDETTKDYAEKFAYAFVAYAIETAKSIEAIEMINPDATLVVIGMYNPLRGLKVSVGEDELDVEEYVDYVIDATNSYYSALSMIDKGFAFVDVSETQTDGINLTLNVADVSEIIDAISPMITSLSRKMHANVEGQAYIYEQVVKALTCDYSVYEAIDADTHALKCSICGFVKATEAHEFGDDNICDKCGYEKVVVPPVDPEDPEDPTPEEPTPSRPSYSGGGSGVKKEVTLSFKDVNKDAWYYSYIKTLFEKGYMKGITETEFAPEATLTRGMFVTVLYRIEGEPKAKTDVTFTDVEENAWFAAAVKWAAEKGIVLGYSETEFAPDEEVTREQMAAILARYVEYKKVKVSAKDDVEYTDNAEISEYAKDAVVVANKLGILIGNDDGSFAPKSDATRAQAAALFARLLDVLKK